MLAILLAAAQAAAPAALPPTPSAIVAAARPAEWVTIAPDDLLVMELAPDAAGRPRRVVIQLIAPPFSQGWVANIRTLARARWWDGTAVTRVQDNYVAQWGDATEAKPLPSGLQVLSPRQYTVTIPTALEMKSREKIKRAFDLLNNMTADVAQSSALTKSQAERMTSKVDAVRSSFTSDPYAPNNDFYLGWPIAFENSFADKRGMSWPVHCYGSVGVGRDLSPDTGTGAELYAVIGHAPRHLDRNIAVVGRVVEGIEHLSSLPRGTGPLGVYATPAERTAIRSVRLASELPQAERPRLQYLSTEGPSFAAYANARANRRDAFFIQPAGGVDVCNVPVPIRRAP